MPTLETQRSTATDPAAAAAATRDLVQRLLNAAVAPRLPFDLLERSLRCYEVEYRGFLSRQRRRPPVDLGEALRQAFQALAQLDLAGSPALRLQSLESRFHAAERLFSLRLDARERGADGMRHLRN